MLKPPVIVVSKPVPGTGYAHFRKREEKRRGRSKSIERDQTGLDDEDDVVRTIEQKLQMSEQMTELLVNRVSSLRTSISDQRRVMSEDLNANSNITSGKVHRAGALSSLDRQRSTSTSGTGGAADHRLERDIERLPWSRVITYASLFGDKEPLKGRRARARFSHADSRRPSGVSVAGLTEENQSSHATSMGKIPVHGSIRDPGAPGLGAVGDDASQVLHIQSEYKRTKKVEYEKELHLLAETHVTRSVENTARVPTAVPLQHLSFKSRHVHRESVKLPALDGAGPEAPTVPEAVEAGKEERLPEEAEMVRRMPFDVRPRLLAAYVLTMIRIPPKENIERTMAMVFQSEILLRILESSFWYIHCLCFQKPPKARSPDSPLLRAAERELELLECTLSALYVKLLGFVRGHVNIAKLDTVYKYLPYAIGHAIITGFRYLCPGSRHMYTYSFKTTVYRVCCDMLLGIEICDVSLGLMRASLFPSESHSDPIMTGAGEAPRPGEPAQDAAHGGGFASAYPEIAESLAQTPEWAPLREASKGARLSMKQHRVKFNGKMKGHLIRSFMSYSAVGHMPRAKIGVVSALPVPHSPAPPGEGHWPGQRSPDSPRSEGSSDSSVVTSISDSVRQARQRHTGSSFSDGSQTNLLTRTMPKQRCKVGPSSTFRSHDSKALGRRRQDLSEQYLDEKSRALKQSAKGRAQLVKEVDRVVTERDQVMNGGVENVGRFCLDLLQSKYTKRNRQDDSSANAQERALVWHNNLDVRLPPSERVLHAMHCMNAARSAEMKRTHTPAKSLLTNKR